MLRNYVKNNKYQYYNSTLLKVQNIVLVMLSSEESLILYLLLKPCESFLPAKSKFTPYVYKTKSTIQIPILTK